MHINKNKQRTHCCDSTAKLLGEHLHIHVFISDLLKILLALDRPVRVYCLSWGASVGSFEFCCEMYCYALFRAAEVVIIFIEFKSTPLWINTDYR
jgi:hypothetical protein